MDTEAGHIKNDIANLTNMAIVLSMEIHSQILKKKKSQGVKDQNKRKKCFISYDHFSV